MFPRQMIPMNVACDKYAEKMHRALEKRFLISRRYAENLIALYV